MFSLRMAMAVITYYAITKQPMQCIGCFMPGDGGNCDALATAAVVFAYDGGGGDSVCCFVPGGTGNCDAVATVAVVFANDDSGGNNVDCFVLGARGNCDPVATVAVVFDSKFGFFVKFLTTHLPIQAWICIKTQKAEYSSPRFFT